MEHRIRLASESSMHSRLDHRELGMMSVNSLERLGNFLRCATEKKQMTAYVGGSGIKKSVRTVLAKQMWRSFKLD